MCAVCIREVELRKIAVRLLSCPDSPYYDEMLRGTDRHDGQRRMLTLELIDELAEKLRCGAVAIPKVLPMRVRHDDERIVKLPNGIYRALGNGSRRRISTSP